MKKPIHSVTDNSCLSKIIARSAAKSGSIDASIEDLVAPIIVAPLKKSTQLAIQKIPFEKMAKYTIFVSGNCISNPSGKIKPIVKSIIPKMLT